MSEIRIRVELNDCQQEFTCELSCGNREPNATQIELSHLMGKAFRVLATRLEPSPQDKLTIQAFAVSALNTELDFLDDKPY